MTISQNSPSKSSSPATETRAIGLANIAALKIVANEFTTLRAIEAGALKATLYGEDYDADLADLEAARIIVAGADRGQPHSLPGGPLGFPSKAPFE